LEEYFDIFGTMGLEKEKHGGGVHKIRPNSMQ